MTHDAFISYSSNDKTTADAACATLERRRIRCWIAPRDVPAGAPWASSLVHAISSSRVMVLILSEGSNHSAQVIREVDEAVGEGVPILPLRIDDVEPSEEMRYYIKSIHWMDALTPPLERHLDQLADSVEALLRVPGDARPAVPPPPPGPPTRSRSLPTWAVPVLIVAIAATVGATAWFTASRQDSSSPADDLTLAETEGAKPAAEIATDELEWQHNPATDHSYALTGTGRSWEALEALAVEAGGHLVAINDTEEEAWLYATFGPEFFWIGLTDVGEEGTYEWTTGEPVTHLPWCPGEPTDIAAGYTEDAVHTIPISRCWNDEATWITEFLIPEAGETIPSYAGVIEVEEPPT